MVMPASMMPMVASVEVMSMVASVEVMPMVASVEVVSMVASVEVVSMVMMAMMSATKVQAESDCRTKVAAVVWITTVSVAVRGHVIGWCIISTVTNRRNVLRRFVWYPGSV